MADLVIHSTQISNLTYYAHPFLIGEINNALNKALKLAYRK